MYKLLFMILLSKGSKVFYLINKIMNRIFLIALSFSLMSPMAVNSDDRIYETKNICGRYYAVEINGGDAARLLGLKDSGRVSSRVEQYCNFFR